MAGHPSWAAARPGRSVGSPMGRPSARAGPSARAAVPALIAVPTLAAVPTLTAPTEAAAPAVPIGAGEGPLVAVRGRPPHLVRRWVGPSGTRVRGPAPWRRWPSSLP